jgi:hypothetical protein
MSVFTEVAMMTPAQREQLIADATNERQRDIDRALRDLEKRLRIRRIASLMPAEATDLPPSLTPGRASAGAHHLERAP